MNYQSNLIIPFEYVVTSGATALAGNASAQVTLTLSADSAFELLAILGTSTLDAATDYSPNNFSVQIIDQSTGRQLSNARVPQRNMFGAMTGNLPEKYPIRFPASCVLLFDILNLSGSSNTVTITLKGYKVYGSL